MRTKALFSCLIALCSLSMSPATNAADAPAKGEDLLDQKQLDSQFSAPLPDLFPDDKKNGSTAPDGSQPSPAEERMMQRMQNIQFDTQMRMQIQQVATWLTEYSMRNHADFPGVETGDAWGVKRNALLQLTELVGTNPYGSPLNVPARNAELSGLGPGLAAYYHADGTPVTGSPVWDDEWTNELAAENQGRVNLVMDYGLTPGEIDGWKQDPPDNWTAAPGTITALGNNQGLIAVWGAGSDGKPIKDTSGAGAFIVSQRVMTTVGDQNAPNEDQ